MRVSVVGCGYLGAVTAIVMAIQGHDVIGVETDSVRLELLRKAVAPFYEPQFSELLADACASGRLTFEKDIAGARFADVHFLCVGTPRAAGSQHADLTDLESCVADLATITKPGDVIVGKSTVPVGTARRLSERLSREAPGVTLIWNPEFLREGFAIHDTVSPDRIVYGVADDLAPEAIARLDEVYRDQIERQQIERLILDYETAELVKVAANSFLATKISFINAVAEVCEAAGADVRGVARAIGMDDRIGPKFLRAGLGFGGGCLPKDTLAFAASARELDAPSIPQLLAAVGETNIRARRRAAAAIVRAMDGRVDGRVALLGAAFKPNSDDMRESPAVALAGELAQRGLAVSVYDPAAGERLAREHPELNVAASPREAMAGSHVTALVTDWEEFMRLDPIQAATWVAQAHLVDCRGLLDDDAWRQAGWDVTTMGVGRRTRSAP